MPDMTTAYSALAPARAEIEATIGPTVLEFGANDCGWCQRAQPVIAQALAPHAGLRHIKVEDGKGRPLGRSYGIKLWPTLIVLRDGREVARVVRPQDSDSIARALGQLA